MAPLRGATALLAALAMHPEKAGFLVSAENLGWGSVRDLRMDVLVGEDLRIITITIITMIVTIMIIEIMIIIGAKG